MRVLALRRCAPAFRLIRWPGKVFRPESPAPPGRAGHSGRDASDPPVRRPGTGSGPGVLAHPVPRPLRVASVPAIPAGRHCSHGRSLATTTTYIDAPCGLRPCGRSLSFGHAPASHARKSSPLLGGSKGLEHGARPHVLSESRTRPATPVAPRSECPNLNRHHRADIGCA